MVYSLNVFFNFITYRISWEQSWTWRFSRFFLSLNGYKLKFITPIFMTPVDLMHKKHNKHSFSTIESYATFNIYVCVFFLIAETVDPSRRSRKFAFWSSFNRSLNNNREIVTDPISMTSVQTTYKIIFLRHKNLSKIYENLFIESQPSSSLENLYGCK